MRITPYLMAVFGLIFLIFGLGIDFGETENSFDAIQVLLGLIQIVIGVLLTGHVPLPFLPQPESILLSTRTQPRNSELMKNVGTPINL